MVNTQETNGNRKRGRSLSISESTFENFLLLLYLILAVIIDFITWLKDLLIDTYTDTYVKVDYIENKPSSNEEKKIAQEKKPLIEVFRVERGFSVIARGIGLTAAYSGRRAMFAVYPALEDGLEVSSEGPASIHFEFKKKDGLLLVGYIAPMPGRYWLRVSRFGRAALGSPFVLTVETAPPGYSGHFGAALWHDVPVRPPVLSGIVDFITEKMYMDEEGRLFTLHKDGSISGERYIVKRRRKSSPQQIPQKDSTIKTFRLSEQKEGRNEPRSIIPPDFKNQMNGSEVLSLSRRGQLSKYQVERAKQLSETASNTSLKLLNVIGADLANPKERILSVRLPEITVTNDEVKEEPRDECNQSRVDQFLSGSKSRYTARRTAKLERVAGDDAVSNEPCDGRGQIGTRGQNLVAISTTNDSNLIDYICQFSRSPKTKKKFHPCNLVATFGLKKNQSTETGIKLLHGIYKVENQEEKMENLNIYRERVLNNEETLKKNYKTAQKFTRDHDLEINNFEMSKCSPKICNSKLLPPNLSDSNLYNKRKVNKKLCGRKKCKEPSTISGRFSTLSLPDFSRIVSMSVQGLRKAKSCSDWSLRTLSSSSLSCSLKNLFEKEHIYHLNKKNLPEKAKAKRPAAELVRIAHYGSGKETKVAETGTTSVDEWKKYWEAAAYKKQKEIRRVCSFEIKGIVTKGKELFESSSDESSSENCLSHQVVKDDLPFKSNSKDSDLTSEKKSAFQKAKEIFEGNYSSLKSMEDPSHKRKRSISERFHISSLSKDIYAGVTPEHLGIPNRIPVVASLGSIHNPPCPNLPISPSHQHSYLWNDILFSDPSYV